MEDCYCYTIFDLVVDVIPAPEESALWMHQVIDSLKFEIKGQVVERFQSPIPNTHAYTAAFILAESHAVIHTAPESSWVEVVFAFCRTVDDDILHAAVKQFFKPKKSKWLKFVTSRPKLKART